MYDNIEIGNRIYTARTSKALKQYNVYQQLGIGQSLYSKIENGKVDIPISLLIQISLILDVSVSWLVGETDATDLTDSEYLEVEKYKKYIISLRKNNK